MTFVPGQARPENAGRKTGTPNRLTTRAREGLKSAIDTCRTGGMTPIEILMENARFLRAVGAALAPRAASPELFAETIRKTPKAELEFIRKFLVDAGALAYKAAEFGYAKLQRIDYVGDAPTVQHVENKIVVELKIGDGEPPAYSSNGSGVLINERAASGNGHDTAGSG